MRPIKYPVTVPRDTGPTQYEIEASQRGKKKQPRSKATDEPSPERTGPFLVEYRLGGKWISPKIDAIQPDFDRARNVADQIRGVFGHVARVRPLMPTEVCYVTRGPQGAHSND